jgi:hypothetical protein
MRSRSSSARARRSCRRSAARDTSAFRTAGSGSHYSHKYQGADARGGEGSGSVKNKNIYIYILKKVEKKNRTQGDFFFLIVEEATKKKKKKKQCAPWSGVPGGQRSAGSGGTRSSGVIPTRPRASSDRGVSGGGRVGSFLPRSTRLRIEREKKKRKKSDFFFREKKKKKKKKKKKFIVWLDFEGKLRSDL